ncbi:MAG: peptidoglycan DD-metalloendopeptidase family protein [Gammaproteobacteria bacterium]|nr:peptidoglycan DD-metalloendopeptidase family protein [Gammaproteobacteria bacterium]
MTSRRVIIVFLALMIASCGASRWQDTPQTHIVRRGETLFSIAWRYDKNPTDLARWNRLGNGSLIYPGQVLRLTPTGAARSPGTAGNRVPPKRDTRPLPDIPAQPAPKWSWPTNGRINVDFRAKPGPGTGVLINGKLGQPIRAAASGRVVYAGDGLIGYGKLIILKHNDTYLSAYGYNASLLVKEGEQINKDQRIATMGEGPERKPRLHFEIRRNGQPVNPRQHLPPR